MPNTTTTPNMNLAVPVVGTQTGPQYATDINNCFTVIDQHDHSSGKGVQISSAGINVTADFALNNFNLTNVRSLRCQSQSAALALSSDLDCFYVVGVDAYYNDGNGNQIRITQSGGIAGSPGSISGLASPAAASYVSANQTFVWQSDSNVAANLDAGSVIFRNLTASSNGVTVSAPTALASNYTVTWPAALPASQKFMTLDASGVMSAPWAVDNSTLQVSSNTVQVKALGITAAQIANLTITAAQIANGTITRTQLIPVGQQVSSSSGAFTTTSSSFVDVTNLTVTITTTGAPVQIMFFADGSGTSPGDQSQFSFSGSTNGVMEYKIFRDATAVFYGRVLGWGTGTAMTVYSAPGSINAMDVVAAGTYVYKLQVAVIGVGSPFGVVQKMKMAAYELL